MALPDDPLIPSRAERIQLLSRLANGETPEQDLDDQGRVIEKPTPMDVRIEAVALLRAMGVTNLPDLSEDRVN